jgi:hypothetical protein
MLFAFFIILCQSFVKACFMSRMGNLSWISLLVCYQIELISCIQVVVHYLILKIFEETSLWRFCSVIREQYTNSCCYKSDQMQQTELLHAMAFEPWCTLNGTVPWVYRNGLVHLCFACIKFFGEIKSHLLVFHTRMSLLIVTVVVLRFHYGSTMEWRCIANQSGWVHGWLETSGWTVELVPVPFAV